MKKMISVLVMLLMFGCGGGGNGPKATSQVAFKPFIRVSQIGSEKYRLLPVSFRLESLDRNMNLIWVLHSMKISQADKDLFLSAGNGGPEDQTYDVSFWQSFSIMDQQGMEYRPHTRNSNSTDLKHLRYGHFGDAGSCTEGTGLTGTSGFINCVLMYEVPNGFVPVKAAFMNDLRFIESFFPTHISTT